MSINIRFERFSSDGVNFYRSENAEAMKVCQQEQIGNKIKSQFHLSEPELFKLKEKFGERVIVLEQDFAVQTDKFRIYQEDLTKRWVGVILNKDGTERKPYYCNSTKYKVLYEMLTDLVEQSWES